MGTQTSATARRSLCSATTEALPFKTTAVSANLNTPHKKCEVF